MPPLRGWIWVGRSLVKTDRIFLINGAAELCSGIVLVKSDFHIMRRLMHFTAMLVLLGLHCFVVLFVGAAQLDSS
jgi:hypothetical protein